MGQPPVDEQQRGGRGHSQAVVSEGDVAPLCARLWLVHGRHARGRRNTSPRSLLRGLGRVYKPGASERAGGLIGLRSLSRTRPATGHVHHLNASVADLPSPSAPTLTHRATQRRRPLCQRAASHAGRRRSGGGLATGAPLRGFVTPDDTPTATHPTARHHRPATCQAIPGPRTDRRGERRI